MLSAVCYDGSFCRVRLLPVQQGPVLHSSPLRGWSPVLQGAQGACRQCTADSARHGQGVAGFEDLLKAFGRHGGTLSVLSWRRQGMQANQAHRFIAMYAIAQVRGPTGMQLQPCILGHIVLQVCLLSSLLQSYIIAPFSVQGNHSHTTQTPCSVCHQLMLACNL